VYGAILHVVGMCRSSCLEMPRIGGLYFQPESSGAQFCSLAIMIHDSAAYAGCRRCCQPFSFSAVLISLGHAECIFSSLLKWGLLTVASLWLLGA